MKGKKPSRMSKSLKTVKDPETKRAQQGHKKKKSVDKPKQNRIRRNSSDILNQMPWNNAS